MSNPSPTPVRWMWLLSLTDKELALGPLALSRKPGHADGSSIPI